MVKITKRALTFVGTIIVDLTIARIFGVKLAVATPIFIITTLLAVQWAHMVYTNGKFIDTLEGPIKTVENLINSIIKK